MGNKRHIAPGVFAATAGEWPGAEAPATIRKNGPVRGTGAPRSLPTTPSNPDKWLNPLGDFSEQLGAQFG